MNLTKERLHEIGYSFLFYKMYKEGLSVKRDMRREICNIAVNINVPREELLALAEHIARTLANIIFEKTESVDVGLSKKRLFEIAYLYLIEDRTREGINLQSGAREDLIIIAEEIGFSAEESLAFAEVLVEEVITATFAEKKKKAKKKFMP